MKPMFPVLTVTLVLLISTSLIAQKDKDKALGDVSLDLIKKTQGIYNNPKLLAVVEQVGRSLEKQLDLGYQLNYYLVDVADPNAFATSGGNVFVTRGLLTIINNKDELAGVMAHELSHVTERHVKKQMTASIFPLVLQLPANIVGALTFKGVGEIVNLPIAATSKIGMAAYSRSQEKSADEKGIALALKAGYNPFGLPSALQRLTAYIEFVSGKAMKKNIFIDHPMTEDRVAKLTQLITKNGTEISDLPAGTDILDVDGLVYGQNPDGGIIQGSKFFQPQIDLYCEFPEKWAVQNSPASVTALAPDKKSSIIISLDTSAATPADAATKALESLKQSTTIESREPTRIHGNEAYRATIRNKESKYANQVAEIMWIKMPTSNVMIKAVGLTSYANPDKSIIECFNTFRLLADEDLKDVRVGTIRLKEASAAKNIDAFSPDEASKEKYIELIGILNALQQNQQIPDGNFLKVIEYKSL